MGVHAVRAALADAGIAWTDVQFAYGGSEDGGNADALVTDLGPTGIPFVNVAQRLRHRRLGALAGVIARSQRARPRSAWWSASTSTRAAPSNEARRLVAWRTGTAKPG